MVQLSLSSRKLLQSLRRMRHWRMPPEKPILYLTMPSCAAITVLVCDAAMVFNIFSFAIVAILIKLMYSDPLIYSPAEA